VENVLLLTAHGWLIGILVDDLRCRSSYMCCGEIFDSVSFVWSADVLLERGRWMMVSSESFGKFYHDCDYCKF